MTPPLQLHQGPQVHPDPLVSVVIPTHRPAYLDATLDSVRAQTFTQYEILVIDDGSPEPAAPARTDDLMLIRQANAGAAAARNRGIEHARAPWIAFLDHDDLWRPAKLARQLAFHERHPELVLSCTDLGVLGDPDAPACLAHHGNGEGVVPFETLLADNCLGTSAVMVRTDAARAAGGFDPAQRYTEDYRFWLEVGLLGPIGFLPEVLADYRVVADSVTREGRARGVWGLAEIEVYDRFAAAHPEWRDRSAWRHGAARACFDHGYARLQHGDWSGARAAMARAAHLRPTWRRPWLNLLRAWLHVQPGE